MTHLCMVTQGDACSWMSVYFTFSQARYWNWSHQASPLANASPPRGASEIISSRETATRAFARKMAEVLKAAEKTLAKEVA